MKKSILIAAVLVSSFVVFAQNEQQKEAEVRAMENAEAQALLQKDIKALQKIWAPGFVVNSPANAVFVGGQIEKVKDGTISYSSFTRNTENVLVLKEVVITMGREVLVPSGSAAMAGQTVNRRFTNIWAKDKGNWMLIARHANVICEPAKTSTSLSIDGSNSFRQVAVVPGLSTLNPK